MPTIVCALYHFARLDDFAALQHPLLAVMKAHEVRGTLLLAQEGINGTIAGSRTGVDAVLATIRSDPRLKDMTHKESTADAMPFNRTKVRLKKEIVTMGVEGIDPTNSAGTYVPPSDWNDLISDPDVIVIDTRNDYEVRIGTFKDALNPQTSSFREFPAFVEAHRDELEDKTIAMFCTGGIRCEKSTAYLREQGFEEVYHLQGGILKYLEDVPEEESLWQGACFVFDERVSVRHGLEVGEHILCRACRDPLTPEDLQHPHYVEGVSCHNCYERTSDAQKRNYANRHEQVRLAQARGEKHIGPPE